MALRGDGVERAVEARSPDTFSLSAPISSTAAEHAINLQAHVAIVVDRPSSISPPALYLIAPSPETPSLIASSASLIAPSASLIASSASLIAPSLETSSLIASSMGSFLSDAPAPLSAFPLVRNLSDLTDLSSAAPSPSLSPSPSPAPPARQHHATTSGAAPLLRTQSTPTSTSSAVSEPSSTTSARRLSDALDTSSGTDGSGSDASEAQSVRSRQRRARNASVPTAPVFNVAELDIGESIGRGSFGDVFRGRWKGQDVAIKRLSTSSPNEANLLCQFRHRNIVQCLGAYFQAPDYVLVMEYAPENLKQAIRLHEITPSTLVEWSLAIATGMNYLHNEAPITVIHRDLKPANILVFPGGLLKITDFGLSRVRETRLLTNDFMSSVGTFEYMAPEVIKSEEYTEKADVFSFGVVVWEMLTKQIPYHGIPSLAVAFGVGSGTLSLPVPSNCPPGIAAMLESCWARDFAHRPSFRELISTMDQIGCSDFVAVPYNDFRRMRDDWGSELEQKMRDAAISAVKRDMTAYLATIQQERANEGVAHRQGLQLERELERAAHDLDVMSERAREGADHDRSIRAERATEGVAHDLAILQERAREGAAHDLGIRKERAREGAAHDLGVRKERAREGAAHDLGVRKERAREGAAHDLGIRQERALEGAAHDLDVQSERAREGAAHDLGVLEERAREGAAHDLGVLEERAREGANHDRSIRAERATEGVAHNLAILKERATEGVAHDLAILKERATEGVAHNLAMLEERAREGAAHDLGIRQERALEGAAHDLGIRQERALEGAAHDLGIQSERAREGAAHDLGVLEERAREGANHDRSIRAERATEGVAHNLGILQERAREGAAHDLGQRRERAEEAASYELALHAERALVADATGGSDHHHQHAQLPAVVRALSDGLHPPLRGLDKASARLRKRGARLRREVAHHLQASGGPPTAERSETQRLLQAVFDHLDGADALSSAVAACVLHQERLLEAARTVASAGQLGPVTPFELHGLVRTTLAPYPHVAYAASAEVEVHLHGHPEAIAAVLRNIMLPEGLPIAPTAGRAAPVTVSAERTAATTVVITVIYASGFTPSALGTPAAATLLALLGGSVTRRPGPPTTFTLTIPVAPVSNP